MSSGKKIPLAIALEYDSETDAAPRVTAKGRGAVAERIVETARAHDIVIDENPLMAAALSQVELDEEIPPKLYQAVAQVIGYVLRVTGERR